MLIRDPATPASSLPSIYSARAANYYVKAMYQPALADYTTVITLEPRNGRAYYGRGTVWYMQRSFDLALGDFDHAVALEPSNALMVFWRGTT